VWHLLEIAYLDVDSSVVYRHSVYDERYPTSVITLGFQVDQRGIKLDRSGSQILPDEARAGRCDGMIQYDPLRFTLPSHNWYLGESTDFQAGSEDPLWREPRAGGGHHLLHEMH